MPSNPSKKKLIESGMEATFNPQPSSDAPSLAGKIAQAFAAKARGEQPPAEAPAEPPSDHSVLSQEPKPMSDHTYQMYLAAEAAKKKYMEENGVDANGDPVKK